MKIWYARTYLLDFCYYSIWKSTLSQCSIRINLDSIKWTAPSMTVRIRNTLAMVLSLLSEGLTTDSRFWKQTTRMHYFATPAEEDTSPDPSLLDIMGSYQHSTSPEISTAADSMAKLAFRNGLPLILRPGLERFVQDHINLFRTTFYPRSSRESSVSKPWTHSWRKAS